MSIKYLSYEQIDKAKWDACIMQSPNGLIYSYSYYLDSMSKHWDALVLNDYEAVMPLTWNKKMGIRYLYQPPFTACLGITGMNIDNTIIEKFLDTIPSSFSYWDIYFNFGNRFEIKKYPLYERMNYVLNLEKPYDILNAKFRDNIRRNVKKSKQLQCEIKKQIPIELVIQLSKDQTSQFSKLSEDDYTRIKNLYHQLAAKNSAITYGVYLQDELLASAAFFFSHNRAYYVLVGNHPNGKTIGASHALINAFIEDHAGQKILLDFEGSDISKLAFFYSSFGAQEEKYVGIKLNRLPGLLKWLKQ